jgi:hypothetical protein
MRGRTLWIVVAAVLAVAAPVASADEGVKAAGSCASVQGAGHRWTVTIDRGRVSCPTARKVLRAFTRGKGRRHGPRNGPASKVYWTLYGWRCQRGFGAVDCTRHGKGFADARDYIYAERQA